MKRSIFFISLIAFVFIGCKKEEINTPQIVESSITLQSITPIAGSTLLGTEMMNAVLDYNIGDGYDPTKLYRASLMLKNTSGGWEFGGNDSNFVDLIAKSGTITIQYDFSDLWSDIDYMHPFTLHFHMIKREDSTPPWSWLVLANTVNVEYAN